MTQVTHVTTGDFTEEVLHSDLPVLVDFYATWCGPCRILAPFLEQLADEFAGRAKVIKVDIDEEPAVAGRYGVSAVPTLLILKDGEVVDQSVGLAPLGVLRERLERVVGAGAPALQGGGER